MGSVRYTLHAAADVVVAMVAGIVAMVILFPVVAIAGVAKSVRATSNLAGTTRG